MKKIKILLIFLTIFSVISCSKDSIVQDNSDELYVRIESISLNGDTSYSPIEIVKLKN